MRQEPFSTFQVFLLTTKLLGFVRCVWVLHCCCFGQLIGCAFGAAATSKEASGGDRDDADIRLDYYARRLQWLCQSALARKLRFVRRKVSWSGWQAAVHPADLKLHLDKWRTSLATCELFQNEVRYRRADGQYRWFLVRAFPLRDRHDKIVKWYGI